jgi:flagellar motor switch protein FliN/FliY
MKSFLESWLTEAPLVLRRELSAELRLAAAEQLPNLAGAFCLGMKVSGARSGRFSILTDRGELHALLTEANVANEAIDFQREAELWQGLQQQIAQVAAAGIGETHTTSVEVETWTLGVPAAAYQLHIGSVAMHIAFADETYTTARVPAGPQAGAGVPETPPEKPRAGVDLLLDVELEASLRFGSREMSLNEVLDLGPGDVVELDRHVAEPVDLLVGDKIVARGEVVLVNGNFGFSVLEVAEAEKRLESIRCLF